MATAEFSKLAGTLSAALSQHHLLGFETAQLEFILYCSHLFHAKVGTIKDRNCTDLTEAEDMRKGGKNTQKNYTKKRSS